MANTASTFKFPYDAENSVTLRSASEDALAAGTAVGDAMDLKTLESYWDEGVVPFHSLAVIFAITEQAQGATSFTVQGSADEAFTTPVDVASLAGIENVGVGPMAIYLDMQTVLNQVSDLKYLRVSATTATSVKFHSWASAISKLV